MKQKRSILLGIILTCTVIFLLGIDVLQAEDFHVTTAIEFQNALTEARDNGQADTIWLAKGIYNASDNASAFTFIAKEGENYDLTIKGEIGTKAEDVILDGNDEYKALSVGQKDAVVNVEEITIINGVSISSSGNIALNNNKIKKNGVSITSFLYGNASIIGNTTTEDSGIGVSTDLGDIVLTNNTLTGSGIYADSSSGNITLNSNTVTGNSGVGVDAHSDLGNIILNENTITNNGGGVYIDLFLCCDFYSYGSIFLENNIITNNQREDEIGCIHISYTPYYKGDITLNKNTITDNIGRCTITFMYSPFGDYWSTSNNIILTNNIISRNLITGGSGGALWISEFGGISITLNNNTITENTGSKKGGGVYIDNYYDYNRGEVGTINLFNNTIKKNNTSDIGGGVSIDGVMNSITLENNTITENKAGSDGGGLNISAAVHEVSLINNTIKRNEANESVGGVKISCLGNFNLINNIVAGNEGSGIYAYTSSGNATLVNNTITGNKTFQESGGLYFACLKEDTTANIYNNIIWGNEGVEGKDIYNDSHIYAIANVHNNNFHDVAGRPFTEDVDNIDGDPLFANVELDDYRLLPDSPCIDKGTADAPELPSTDFEGDERIIGNAPDIGADEFDPSSPPTTTSTSSTTSIPITSTTSTTTLPVPDTTTTTTSPQPCVSETLYGENSAETELLRYFRDNVMSRTPEGQELIRLYYELSSTIVQMMEEDEEFKEQMEEMIDGVLELIGGEVK